MRQDYKSQILKGIDEVLVGHGFKRKKKTWHCAKDETILLVDLQKSDWGDEYYVNLGVLMRALSDNPQPKINECHISERLDNLSEQDVEPANIPSSLKRMLKAADRPLDMSMLSEKDLDWLQRNRSPLEKALDFEDAEVHMRDRIRIVQYALKSYGIPFLASCESVAKVRRLLRTDSLAGVAVWKVVYNLCKVPFKE